MGASQSGLLKDRQPINTPASTVACTHVARYHLLRCARAHTHTHAHRGIPHSIMPWKPSPGAAPKPGDYHSHLLWNKGCEILPVIIAPLSALPACLCHEAALSSIAQSFILPLFPKSLLYCSLLARLCC